MISVFQLTIGLNMSQVILACSVPVYQILQDDFPETKKKWLWLDKVILEIVKPHYFVLCSSREIVSLKKNLKLAGHLVFNIKPNESCPPVQMAGIYL